MSAAAGAALLVAGSWLAWPPAGLLTAGAILLTAGLFVETD